MVWVRNEKCSETGPSSSSSVEASRPTRHIICHFVDRFLRVRWPNQHCQSTEGRHKTKL